MDARHIGPTQLSEISGVPFELIKKYLAGKVDNPRGGNIEKLATAVGVSLAFLITGEEAHSSTASYIPLRVADVRPGMGGPAEAFGDGDGKVAHFPPELISSLRTKPADLWVMQLEGNSMSPFLEAGDMVIVDSTKKSPSQPGAFVVWDGFGMVCKWVERILNSDPPKVRLISQNGIYKPVELTIGSPGEAEAYVMGRVVWMSRKL